MSYWVCCPDLAPALSAFANNRENSYQIQEPIFLTDKLLMLYNALILGKKWAFIDDCFGNDRSGYDGGGRETGG